MNDRKLSDKVLKKKDGSSNLKLVLLLSGPVILVFICVLLYLLGDRYVETDNVYVKAGTVSISSEVSGKILEIKVNDNSHVSSGDELFQIDTTPFEIEMRRAQANLLDVHANIESLRSDYRQKLANLALERETLDYRNKEYKRYQGLAKRKAIRQDKKDEAEYDLHAAQKSVEVAEQELASVKAKMGGDDTIAVEQHPLYKLAQAQLQQAEYNFARTVIHAPSDGVVANVSAQPGEYAVSGLPLFSLIDDNELWLEANFKETDLTHIRVGQKAEVSVDTYPSIRWQARVASITPATGSEFSILPAQNSSGNWVKVVQRIMIKFEFIDDDEAQSDQNKPDLVAGMSANVSVDTGRNRIQRFFGGEEQYQSKNDNSVAE